MWGIIPQPGKVIHTSQLTYFLSAYFFIPNRYWSSYVQWWQPRPWDWC